MSATVPAILKYLSNNQNFSMDQDSDMPQRAKKRRLDHLSWEEKIQRKKLKNRVAAQTSRDRKKAKMEQMEQALQQLFSQNEALMTECENLKLTNQKLTQEKTELYNRLQAPCANCSQNRTVECEAQNGSTARKGHTLSSGFGQPISNSSVEDNTDLPSLPDLLDELDADVDINSLEQLTQSLLQDIARDLEAAAQKTDCQEPVSNRQDNFEKMVGPPSTKLESSGRDDKKSLENDISEYLLLHHNYAAKPPKRTQRPKSSCAKSKLKTIKPKKNTNVLNTNKLAVDVNTPVIVTDNNDIINSETVVYGTYDEGMNCVTIIIDDNGIPINEAVTEITTTEDCQSVAVDDTVTDNTMLTVPSQIWGNASPMSTSSSDNGYESLDSPNSLSEMDIWDQSVSELFPTLF